VFAAIAASNDDPKPGFGAPGCWHYADGEKETLTILPPELGSDGWI